MEKEYRSLLPPNLGGTNPACSSKQLAAAAKMDLDVCTVEMANQVRVALQDNKKVLVVLADEKHRSHFLEELLKLQCGGMDMKTDVFNIERGKSLNLTTQAVRQHKVHPYRVVTAINKKMEGCCLDALDTLIRTEMHENLAHGQQRLARINRMGQEAERITEVIVHTGLISLLLFNHIDGKALLREMNSNAAKINLSRRLAPLRRLSPPSELASSTSQSSMTDDDSSSSSSSNTEPPRKKPKLSSGA